MGYNMFTLYFENLGPIRTGGSPGQPVRGSLICMVHKGDQVHVIENAA